MLAAHADSLCLLSHAPSVGLQIASYAGLDIVAKVVFGWIIMLLGYPMIGKQMTMEHEQ